MMKFKQFITEGVKAPKNDKVYSQEEAAKLWKIDKKDVVLSDRIVKGKFVWINDVTSETVYADKKNYK